MMTYQQAATLLDFSQWETAIQNFFCQDQFGFVTPPVNGTPDADNWQPGTGSTAFFTGFQAQVFTKARPRVDLGLIQYSEFQETRIVDSNGRLWRNAWRVPLEFHVITKSDYAYHMTFLAQIRAIVHLMNPTGIDPATGQMNQALIATTGLNQFLSTHELAQVSDAGNQTFGGKWSADAGYFLTTLKYNSIFAIAAASWPGGTLNA